MNALLLDTSVASLLHPKKKRAEDRAKYQPPTTPTQPGRAQERPGALPATAGGAPRLPGTVAPPGPAADKRATVSRRFTAARDQIYKAFNAIASPADKSDGGKITLEVEGTNQRGFDRSWLPNAVQEPHNESNVERQPV